MRSYALSLMDILSEMLAKTLIMSGGYFVNNNTCPVCGNINFKFVFKHKKWGGDCFRCLDCTHIFYLDHNNKLDPSDFGTNVDRANYYLDFIKNIVYDSIIDIGAPKDLYFLKKIHEKKPSARKIAFDIFLHKAPPYIEMTDTLDKINVDIAMAVHVIEHVLCPLPFLKKIIEISKFFVVEVPDETEEWRSLRSTNNPHYHCFTRKSLTLLFDLCKTNYHINYRVHAGNHPMLCVHNLQNRD